MFIQKTVKKVVRIHTVVYRSLILIVGGIYYAIFRKPYVGDVWGEALNIHKKDIVLEIGPGSNPSLRADVLCEKLITVTTERRQFVTIPKDRPFIVGDGCSLPFLNNAFDYVICKHVIEHLDNPEQMLEELKRVSKKGYISAPHGFRESVSPAPYHKWFVFIENGSLILEQKTRREDRKYKDKASRNDLKKEVKYE